MIYFDRSAPDPPLLVIATDELTLEITLTDEEQKLYGNDKYPPDEHSKALRDRVLARLPALLQSVTKEYE